MRATHADYQHPRHLRVEEGGEVFCLSPSHSQYSRLNRASLPSCRDMTLEEFDKLPRHSTSVCLLKGKPA